MTADGRPAFLDRIRSALDRPERKPIPSRTLFPESPSRDESRRLAAWQNRSREEQAELLDTLVENAREVNLEVVPAARIADIRTAVMNLVNEKSPEWGKRKSVAAWRHPLIEAMGIDAALSELDIPVVYPETGPSPLRPPEAGSRGSRIMHAVTQAFIGITAADFCIADTATLVMKTRPGHARMISLLPTIHVAVIQQNRLLRDLRELYTLLRWHPVHRGLSNCTTFITGPSKTADIEATLVHGAHGPREVHLFVLTG